MVSRRNFCDAESLVKRYGENMPLRSRLKFSIHEGDLDVFQSLGSLGHLHMGEAFFTYSWSFFAYS